MPRARGDGQGAGPTTTLGLLGRAGFTLPYVGGWWRHFAFGESFETGDLHVCLTKSVLLARGEAALDWQRAETAGEVALTFRLGTASVTRVYGPELGERDALEILVSVYRALNELLEAGGVAHRFLIACGAPVFPEHRLLWLPPPWIDQVAALPGAETGCLTVVPAAPQAAPAPPARPPAALAAVELARLPRLGEVVPESQVLESDFKASSRESDLEEIFQEIARFARVAVRSEGIAWSSELGDHYFLMVTRENETTVLRMTDNKYVDVRPMLAYLNEILKRLGRPERLVRFEGGYFSAGVVRAQPAELAELRQLAYVVEDVESDGGGGVPAVTVLPMGELARAIEAGDVAQVVALERAQPYPTVFDRSLEVLGRARATRATVARILGKLGPVGRQPDLGVIVLLAWAEAGLAPPATLEVEEARDLLAAWRDTIVGSRPLWIPLSRLQFTLIRATGAKTPKGPVGDVEYELAAPQSWIPARRLFDVIVTRGDLDPSTYCNALYAAQHGNTGIAVDRDLDARLLDRCLPIAERNPAIYVNAACLYFELGDPEKAREMLDAAMDRGQGPVVADQLRTCALFGPYRDDPRFAATWRRAGVPTEAPRP